MTRPFFRRTFSLSLLVAATIQAQDLPIIAIGDASACEPPAGAGVISMMVSLSAPVSSPVTAIFTSRPGAATTDDFRPVTGLVEIPPGKIRAMIRISVFGDAEVEEDEPFLVELSDVQGAQPGRLQGRATIIDAGPRPIISLQPAVLYEDGPPAPKPLVIELADNTPVTVNWQMRASSVASVLYRNPATAGDDFDDTLHSVTGRGPVLLPLAALPDAVTDGSPDSPMNPPSSEAAAVRLRATSPVAYTTFEPEFLVDLPPDDPATPARPVYPVATTDGEWVATARAEYTPPGPATASGRVGLYRRDPANDGRWDQAPTIELGPGRLLTEMVMRRGRLVICTTRGLAIYEAPSVTGAGPWTAVNLPADSGLPVDLIQGNSEAGVAFDGDTLVVLQRPPVSTGRQRFRFMERLAPSGGWAPVQEELLAPEVFVHSVTVHGDTAFIATSRPEATLVEWRRTGPPERPWVPRQTIPSPPLEAGQTSSGYDALALHARSLHALHYRNPDAESIIFHLADSGEWRIEQRSLPPQPTYHPTGRMTTFAAAGVLVSEYRIYSRTGPDAEPWRLSAAPPQLQPGVFQPIAGHTRGAVMLQSMTVGTEHKTIISTPGAALTLIDEDSALWSIEPTSPSPQFPINEPSIGPMKMNIALRGPRVPFPVNIGVRIAESSTATAGIDYVAPSVHLEWWSLPGFSPPNFPLSILADSLLEAPETVEVLLHSPSYGRISGANPTIYTIQDPRTLLSPPSAEVFMLEPDSGSQEHPISLVLSRALPEDRHISVTIVDRGAAVDLDYTLPARLTIPAGARYLTLPVQVRADTEDEPIEAFQITLGNLPEVYPNPSRIMVRIVDRLPEGRGSEPDVYAVAQNTPVSAGHAGDAKPGVSSNDPGTTGTVRLTHPPSHGALALDPVGAFTYTPPPNFVGSATFSYEARLGTEPILLLGSNVEWRYLHPLDGVDPAIAQPSFAVAWPGRGFDDARWGVGTGLLGYGGMGQTNAPPDVDIGTPPSGSRYTAYFRTRFDAPAQITADLTVRFSCDDAAIFYINGQEVGRYPAPSTTELFPPVDSYRLSFGLPVDGAGETAIQSLRFRGVPLFPEGNVLAVSIHNAIPSSSDLGFRLVDMEALERWSEPTPVTLLVGDGMTPPLLQPDHYVCPQGSSLDSTALTTGGLLHNDSLLDSLETDEAEILEIEVTPLPSGARFVIDATTGDFQYTPPPHFFGSDSFAYRVRDKDGWSLATPVVIEVEPSNAYDLWRKSTLGLAHPTPGTEADQRFHDQDLTHLEAFHFFSEVAAAAQAGSVPVEIDAAHADGIGIRFQARILTEVITTVEATSSLAATEWEPLARWQGNSVLFVADSATLGQEAVAGEPDFRRFLVVEKSPARNRRYFRVRTALPESMR